MGRSTAIRYEPREPLPGENCADRSEDDPRWRLAQRVVAGRHFVRSPLLSKFLLHVVAETLAGREKEITEHQIGVQVFDRQPSYRTVEDNIVRNYARQLRRRLAEHFADEGCTEAQRIEIPLGGYIPVFVSTSDMQTADEEQRRSVPLAIQTQPVGVPSPADAPVASSNRRWESLRNALLLTAYSVALVCLTWFAAPRIHAAHKIVEPTQPLWEAIFNGSSNAYIVPADAGANLIEDLSHRPLQLPDYIDGSYLGLPLENVDAHSAEDLRTQQFTSFVDLQIVTALARRPEFNPQHDFLRFPRDLQLDDLKNASGVIIGSVGSNPWVGIAESNSNFRIVYDNAMQGAVIVNAKPQPGEASTYVSHWNEPAHETFALIAFLPNLGGNGHLLLLQGLDVAGTQAAAETLFHPDAIVPILRRATRPDGSLRPFEILLRSTSIESNATGTHVIASRIY